MYNYKIDFTHLTIIVKLLNNEDKTDKFINYLHKKCTALLNDFNKSQEDNNSLESSIIVSAKIRSKILCYLESRHFRLVKNKPNVQLFKKINN